MHKSLNAEQQAQILDVFSDYLSQQKDIEFVQTKNFGLLNIAVWSSQSYDIVQIDSVDSLCEILLDMIVQDYLIIKEQLCIKESEIQVLYKDYIQKYIVQLPAYRDILQEKFEKIIAAAICNK